MGSHVKALAREGDARRSGRGTAGRGAAVGRAGAVAGEIRDVMDSFRRIVHALRMSGQGARGAFDLSAAQLFVLREVQKQGSPSVNELAAATHTDQSSVSAVVQKLVDKKLVIRSRSAADKRKAVVTLTVAARALLRRVPSVPQDRLIAAIQNLPSGERQLLARMLQELAMQTDPQRGVPPLFFEESSRNAKARSNDHP